MRNTSQNPSLENFTVLIPILLLALLLVAPFGRAQEHVPLPVELQGTLNKADYKIRVPAFWNGTLLVYVHGWYQTLPSEADAAFGGEPMEKLLLDQGYALAGSSYRNPGWGIKEGVQNTLALTNFFKGHVGNPLRTIIWGPSSGGQVSIKSIEKFPGIYDGAIPACAPGGGAPRKADRMLDFDLAYAVAFGWPANWGTVADLRDDLTWVDDVMPVVWPQIMNPANFGLWEFVRLVNHLPLEDYYSHPLFPAVILNMFFSTEARAELEGRAGGPVAQNVGRIYYLTAGDIAYLNGLGVDAEGLLAAMNAQTDIEAHRPAREYVERYADFTGKMKGPVLTIHTKIDGGLIVNHQSVYLETVEAAGNGALLVQAFTNGIGHCAFTPDQLLAVVEAMDCWLETGDPPGSTAFPEALGFDNSFVPPPWPYED